MGGKLDGRWAVLLTVDGRTLLAIDFVSFFLDNEKRYLKTFFIFF